MLDHKSVLADLLTPVSAFLRISPGVEHAFLFESVEGGEKIGRYSFMGVNPHRNFQGSFADFRSSFPGTQAPHTGLPPFTGGAVGVFFYDMVREFERLPNLHDGTSASVLMDFYSTVLAFDHVKRQIVIMSHEGREKIEELEDKLLRAESKSEDHGAERSNLHPLISRPRSSTRQFAPKSNFTGRDFRAAVKTAQEYIAAGDVFQVVLSQRFETDFAADPFNVYRALRYINPSPYLFFLKRGDLCVAGSSPEMLVRVQGSDLDYRPIAGTRRRGRDADEERKLEEELVSDEKERAEHLMLVDLGRNDLGRVCRYGSVRVESLMSLEKYSHVMHLVSALKGLLRPEFNRFDALAACFPAGTVTGAPKVRAMEIIEELEPCRREIYAGAIGYLDFSGNLDTCIAIRTIVMRNGKAYLQAGAGIVADSVPELENKECYNKALALFEALERGSSF